MKIGDLVGQKGLLTDVSKLRTSSGERILEDPWTPGDTEVLKAGRQGSQRRKQT